MDFLSARIVWCRSIPRHQSAPSPNQISDQTDSPPDVLFPFRPAGATRRLPTWFSRPTRRLPTNAGFQLRRRPVPTAPRRRVGLAAGRPGQPVERVVDVFRRGAPR